MRTSCSDLRASNKIQMHKVKLFHYSAMLSLKRHCIVTIDEFSIMYDLFQFLEGYFSNLQSTLKVKIHINSENI